MSWFLRLNAGDSILENEDVKVFKSSDFQINIAFDKRKLGAYRKSIQCNEQCGDKQRPLLSVKTDLL